jgi:hypothetical protein
MKSALACVALVGCTPVAWWTSPTAIQTVAPALRADGSATLDARDVDERPPADLPSPAKPETVRLDQPIGVRLAAQSGDWPWVHMEAQSAETSMTIADLIADCPPDFENTPANRSAYPRCTLFRADNIRLRSSHRGYRATRSDIITGAILVGLAGDVTCIFECDRAGARASEVVLTVGAVSVIVVGFYYFGKALLGSDDHLKH